MACSVFQDIFQFAGLAMIFTAFLLKIRLDERGILMAGILLSCVERIIPDIHSGNEAFNLIMGTFVTASKMPSHFSFFNWYIFVAAGMFFAQIIKRVRNESKFYLRVMLGSGLCLAAFSFGTSKFGLYFLNKYHRYYSVSPLEAVAYLSITLFMLSLLYFLVQRVKTNKISIFLSMSRNLP